MSKLTRVENWYQNPYTCVTFVLNYHGCEELVVNRLRQVCEEMESNAIRSRFKEYYECEVYACMLNEIGLCVFYKVRDIGT